MKIIWTLVNKGNFSIATKNRLFVTLAFLVSALAGIILWLLVGRLALNGTEWVICFAGYPGVFIGIIGGLLYLYNHQYT